MDQSFIECVSPLLEPGLHIISGAPGSGKSQVALVAAADLYLNVGRSMAYIGLDLTGDLLLHRLRRLDLPEDQVRNIIAGCVRLPEMPRDPDAALNHLDAILAVHDFVFIELIERLPWTEPGSQLSALLTTFNKTIVLMTQSRDVVLRSGVPKDSVSHAATSIWSVMRSASDDEDVGIEVTCLKNRFHDPKGLGFSLPLP